MGEIIMFKIVNKRVLNPSVVLMDIQAPFIAKKAKAGQFIIFRIDEQGERGPLGIPTHIDENAKKVCVIGGGVGCAIAYPQAKELFEKGVEVDVIAGFRSRDIVILEEEFSKKCKELIICTDDGSYGKKGFVTDALKEQIEAGKKYDAVIAIGPVPMMKFVCAVTKPYDIKTIVSLNPIMIDGTGMCGGCRVTVGGQIKYACVDGPDFDGHQVDFDELMKRNSTYREQEHDCRMMNNIK